MRRELGKPIWGNGAIHGGSNMTDNISGPHAQSKSGPISLRSEAGTS